MDNLLLSYDLSTITKQVITHNDGLFDNAKYLAQPHTTSRPHMITMTPCIICARPRMISWASMMINVNRPPRELP